MRLGLDLDGVIYRWSEAVRDLVKEGLGIELQLPARHWYDLRDQMGLEAWRWLWTDGMKHGRMYSRGDAYRGAVAGVQTLHARAEVVLITSRPTVVRAETEEWLRQNKIPYDELHILPAARRGMPGARKSDVQPRCQVYLDDSEEVVAELLENTRAKILMPARPWNAKWRKGFEHPRLTVVRSWKDVLSVLE